MLPKVLLVEDEDLLREINEVKLKIEGFDYKTAKHGKEALTVLKKFPADIILLDMLMPVMNGIEFMREFRKNNGHADVIILSNISSPESTREAMHLGAKEYLNKSQFTPEEVTNYIKHYWDTRDRPAK